MPVRLGLKFAVVREDPELEAHVIRTYGVRRALLVASGGCTALSLLAETPELEVTAFDLNPRQLEQVREKAAAAAAGELARLNVGNADEHGLNQSGEFEGLFRTLRQMLLGFVVTERELETFFSGDSSTRAALASTWTTHRYWPACFAACFSDGLLHAMFGAAATQHAQPGSYPGYFRELFERGLVRDDAAAGQGGGHRHQRVGGAGHHHRVASAGDARHLGQAGQ